MFERCSVIVVLAAVCGSSSVQAATRYVKTDGSTSSTCQTWATACTMERAIEVAGALDQIWVQAGTYGPVSVENRSLRLYGGFAGTETLVSQSNPQANVTVISGSNNTRAVGIQNAAQAIIIRGFRIQDGRAQAVDFTENGGGGALVVSASPSFVNCVFTNNYCDAGGAVGIYGGSPKFVNCIFRENGYRSTPTPAWTLNGGAVFAWDGSPEFHNCLFDENTAYHAGAVFVRTEIVAPLFVNCTFVENSATVGNGGAIYDLNGRSQINNSIFWNNTAVYGNQIASEVPGNVAHSDVQGGWVGISNLDSDPLFIDATNDVYRLDSGSPCLNTGSTSALSPDNADLDWDGNKLEPLSLDLGLMTRVVESAVDMGAHERNIMFIFD